MNWEESPLLPRVPQLRMRVCRSTRVLGATLGGLCPPLRVLRTWPRPKPQDQTVQQAGPASCARFRGKQERSLYCSNISVSLKGKERETMNPLLVHPLMTTRAEVGPQLGAGRIPIQVSPRVHMSKKVEASQSWDMDLSTPTWDGAPQTQAP